MAISQAGAQAAALSQIQSAFPIASGLLPAEASSIASHQTLLAQVIATQALYVQLSGEVASGISLQAGPYAGSTTGTGKIT